MESCQREESKSSSEEIDDGNDDDTGTGRSYECVFCKRGFTTAQALGGHMNIHRKDRAKTKPSSSTTSNSSSSSRKLPHENNYANSILYTSNPIHPQYTFMAFDSQINPHMYFPGVPTSVARPPYAAYHTDDPRVLNSSRFNSYEEGWCTSLSLNNTSMMHVEDIGKKRSQGCNKEEELDLELRLGHDP